MQKIRQIDSRNKNFKLLVDEPRILNIMKPKSRGYSSRFMNFSFVNQRMYSFCNDQITSSTTSRITR